MTQKITIEIKTNPRPKWRVFAITLGGIFSILGMGIVADSPAMQWFGFIMAWAYVFGLGVAFSRQDKGLTIEQPRARLNEIEADEVGK